MDRETFARRTVAGSGWPEWNERLYGAFRDTSRERFLPSGTPASRIYSDETINLGIPGINNGQPSLHAGSIAALAPETGETVVHVGAGTGYYTAILAAMVGREGRVHAYEIEAELAERARQNLSTLPQVSVHAESGAESSLPTADVIYVNCGATGPQPAWLAALRPRGRLLFPLTGAYGAGVMLLTERPAVPSETWPARLLQGVTFIDCRGAGSRRDEAAITQALGRGNASAVRWLHLGPARECPNAIWLAGTNWQLATSN